jgi:hypothetical protein
MQAAHPNSRAAASSILHPGHSGWHKAAPLTRCWARPGTYYDRCQKQNWHVRLRFSSFGVSQYDWGGKLFIIQSVWGVPGRSRVFPGRAGRTGERVARTPTSIPWVSIPWTDGACTIAADQHKPSQGAGPDSGACGGRRARVNPLSARSRWISNISQ